MKFILGSASSFLQPCVLFTPPGLIRTAADRRARAARKRAERARQEAEYEEQASKRMWVAELKAVIQHSRG